MIAIPHLDPAIALALRLGLALVLLSAALHKLRAPHAFRAVVTQYRMLPAPFAHTFAAALPWIELAIAAALVLADGPIAALALATLLTLYGGAMAINLVRGRREIACGCSGIAAERPIGPGLLLRNAGLILVALGLCLPAGERGLHAIDVFTIALGGVGLALLNATIEVALANAHRLAGHAGAEA